MANTRMEGRVESVEHDVGMMKGELGIMRDNINQLKICMKVMRDSIAKLGGRGKEIERA